MNEKIKEWMSKNSFLFIILIPVFLIVAFRDVLISLLLSSAHKTVDEAKKKDETLAVEETKANTQANDLVKQADDLAKQEGKPVGEDWYKNEH